MHRGSCCRWGLKGTAWQPGRPASGAEASQGGLLGHTQHCRAEGRGPFGPGCGWGEAPLAVRGWLCGVTCEPTSRQPGRCGGHGLYQTKSSFRGQLERLSHNHLCVQHTVCTDDTRQCSSCQDRIQSQHAVWLNQLGIGRACHSTHVALTPQMVHEQTQLPQLLSEHHTIHARTQHQAAPSKGVHTWHLVHRTCRHTRQP